MTTTVPNAACGTCRAVQNTLLKTGSQSLLPAVAQDTLRRFFPRTANTQAKRSLQHDQHTARMNWHDVVLSGMP
jgi:hypothetical protein